MSMNLIAMLVSLAMMLTGAGGAARPESLPAAATARTVTVSNVTIDWNGETLRLAPQAHVGVSTDGESAVYDFGVDLDGKELLPVQVSVGEKGITALYGKNGMAVNVTAGALEGLAAQLEAQMNASLAQSGGDGVELMRFLTGEYMPAYANLLQLAMDRERYEEINARAQAVFNRVIDRGEGTPAKLEGEAAQYDVTAYSYSIDAMQMAALTDAVYQEVPEFNDYYSALFRLYDMLPEESGLRGLDSFTALFERFGVQMRLDIEEKRTEDGAVDDMDGVLTVDVNSMLAVPATDAEVSQALADGTDEIAPEATEAPAQPALEPIVMNLHSLKTPEYSEANVTCTYALDGRHTLDIAFTASDGDGVQEFEATVFQTEDGKKTHGGKVSGYRVEDGTDTVSYNVGMKAIRQDAARVEAMFFGVENADGTSENSFAVDVRTRKRSAGLSFDLAVTNDAIEDAASAAEPACVIDDLSQEGMQALARDPARIGALMQAAGALAVDFNQLASDPGVKSALALARHRSLPIDVEDLDDEDFDIDMDFGGEPEGDGEYGLVIGDDGEYELAPGDGDETAFDFDDEPVEDDGVLAFAEPRLTWLPDGWKVAGTEVDTAYDWVQMSIVDADGAECAYAIFFLDTEAETANYIVQKDGKVLDGRMMNVTDFGEGGLSVTVSESGMYGNLMFTSEAIELDTIGRIVAGIEF